MIAAKKKTQTKHHAYRTVITSTRWRKLRNAYIVAQPLCEPCLSQGKTTPAQAVHHIKPLEDYLDMPHIMQALAYDPNNLMSVCDPCHGTLHRELNSRSREAHKARASAKTALFRQKFLEREG